MDSLDSRFGQPDDWGLSPQRHGEIANELGDHLDCLQQDEGKDAADKTERKLAEPKVRRRLTVAHITDQVVATLHRRPNPAEWRELGWLVFWFVLAICGDMLAGHCTEVADGLRSSMWKAGSRPESFSMLAMSSWLLLGISRAMFFYILLCGVKAAWQNGWGVLIARLLQYKLIHTLMVFLGMILLGLVMTQKTGWGMRGRLDGVPAGITDAAGAGLLLAIAVACIIPRWRRSAMPAICFLSLIFLYPTGPAVARRADIKQPYPVKVVGEDANHRYLAAEDDPARIRKVMENHERINGALPAGWTEDNMVLQHWMYEVSGSPLNAAVIQQYHHYGRTDSLEGKPTIIAGETKEYGPAFSSAPAVHAGSGLAWIAAPVPFMGIAGLLAMLFIMGRRGLLPAVLYGLLTIVALFCSVLPFVMGRYVSDLFELSPLAFSHGPLPGFEQVLGYKLNAEGYMIMGALLLSAGIPWLLTGLFLRSDNGKPHPVDDDGQIATG